MDQVHIHLLLNHVAILGVIFSFVLLIFGVFKSERILFKSALIGFVFSALVAIPVFLTGEGAEETVEDMPGITHEIIDEHEESAEFAIWMVEILGLISLVTLFAADKYRRPLTSLVIIFAIISTGTLVYYGMEGGKIRHSELRDSSAAPVKVTDDESDEH